MIDRLRAASHLMESRGAVLALGWFAAAAGAIAAGVKGVFRWSLGRVGALR